MVNFNQIIRKAIEIVPEVVPLLTGRARWYARAIMKIDLKGLVVGDDEIGADWIGRNTFTYRGYKTYDYFLANILHLIRNLYESRLGGEFIDIMANLISGQLTQAYQQAFEDSGFTGFFLPDYLQSGLERQILNQYTFVDQFFRDIVDARLDGTSIDPLLARAKLWAGQWDTAYQNAITAIELENGGKLKWVEGDTKEKCSTCVSLDGVVMFAKEWETLGIRPRNAPNGKLACGGWNCQCRLEPTEQRRSPDAYGRVEEILL